jgi:hypothetical protein
VGTDAVFILASIPWLNEIAFPQSEAFVQILHKLRPNRERVSMEPIKISMRGLAEVACAKPSQKQSKLKRFKFPESEESVGRSNYYVWALSAIKHHHRGDSGFVDEMLHGLWEQAATESDSRKKAKFLNNHRAITDYLKHFGGRMLEVRSGKRLYFNYGNLIVNAHPDLVVEEGGRLLLIKLNCCKEDFAGGVTATLLHVLYESARLKGLEIGPSSVECLHTSSGSRITGPKTGFPNKSALNSACKELLELWPAA